MGHTFDPLVWDIYHVTVMSLGWYRWKFVLHAIPSLSPVIVKQSNNGQNTIKWNNMVPDSVHVQKKVYVERRNKNTNKLLCTWTPLMFLVILLSTIKYGSKKCVPTDTPFPDIYNPKMMLVTTRQNVYPRKNVPKRKIIFKNWWTYSLNFSADNVFLNLHVTWELISHNYITIKYSRLAGIAIHYPSLRTHVMELDSISVRRKRETVVISIIIIYWLMKKNLN